MQTRSDLKSLATQYIEFVGNKNYDAVADILAPDVSFKGPFMASNSAQDFIAALRRMAPIWKGNVLRAAFADDERACVIYDFVSNTEAGSIPSVELLTFRDDRISSVELFFDRMQFAPAIEALKARSA